MARSGAAKVALRQGRMTMARVAQTLAAVNVSSSALSERFLTRARLAKEGIVLAVRMGGEIERKRGEARMAAASKQAVLLGRLLS
jgi:hypothetical protein